MVQPPPGCTAERAHPGRFFIQDVDDGYGVAQGCRVGQRRIVIQAKVITKPDNGGRHASTVHAARCYLLAGNLAVDSLLPSVAFILRRDGSVRIGPFPVDNGIRLEAAGCRPPVRRKDAARRKKDDQ